MSPARRSSRLVAGVGLDGDQYVIGGGTWAQYREVENQDLEKQLTLIDADDVAAVASETGSALGIGDASRNPVSTGIDLPGLVCGWSSSATCCCSA
ncbi:MAG: hypothetical protein ACXVFX_14220 [Blastococcus sp.]